MTFLPSLHARNYSRALPDGAVEEIDDNGVWQRVTREELHARKAALDAWLRQQPAPAHEKLNDDQPGAAP